MPKDRFTKDELGIILQAVREAEKNTSGEIRVHIDSHCEKTNVLDRASEVFAKLKMHKTALRNGVLIYVALDDHKLAVIGDGGINGKVPAGFWDETIQLMSGYFKDGRFVEGIAAGVEKAGNQLKAYFPYQKDDTNELSDDISFGGNK